ncbi:hypothetical protein [Auritidibacter ignavus]|uniref:Uncharacterized protein n=1 Tax=Auritidibacter ignavus TaxID=678932 RepID=A0AAJ6API7_9MICC|nr:hypothetical protein [Auritidibacter ignavus]WGH84407.1 hypothetical protein QDX20_02455 [Auritidibacter ignavus]WGH93730.1 hypothetical protein QDX21_02730 [Auritidibacter ignavus]WHS27911.1 hypothetical protein QM395_11200 [Auritidibacter ignavus]
MDIVAGLADDEAHLRQMLPHMPRDRELAVHVDATPETLRGRIHRRGWLIELVDDAVKYAAELEPSAADLYLDTTHQTPSQLSDQITAAVLAHAASGPADPEDAFGVPPEASGSAEVVVLTGPGGVGVSTIGFQPFMHLAHAGRGVGYLDAHQLGLLGPSAGSSELAPLRAQNARTVVGTLAAGGAETVVVSGDPHAVRAMEETWDSGPFTPFWLDASADALAERITARAQGGGPPLQGDHRLGLAGAALDAAIAAAVEESRQHHLRPPNAHVVNTTDREPSETAAAIAAALPWT